MKRILILFLAILLTGFSSTEVELNAGEKTKVYVVMSNNAYAYHKTRSCRAVQKATHEVKEVSLEKAKKMGRTPCKICYK